MKPVKRIRALKRILKETGTGKIALAFLIHVMVSAAVIWLIEPGIDTYGKALWYCYTVVTTIGFGDVVAQSLASRILSVLLSVDAALVIALITGVVVNYYIYITELRQKGTLNELADKLERLPELSREELEDISIRVRAYLDRK